MWTVLSLVVLAFALAADAFAVALAQGVSGRATLRHALAVGTAFGLAQGAMPLAGWALGVAFVGLIAPIDHWVALILLAFVGGRMIHEARHGPAGDAPLLRGWGLIGAAIVTSLDALAAGITLPAFEVPVLIACGLIALVTFITASGGVLAGRAAGLRLGRKAELAGGLLLVGLGLKIFVEHEFLGG